MPWPLSESERNREIPLPDWLKPRQPVVQPEPSPEVKALEIAHYEMLFPRVLNMIAEGYTLTKAVRELPIPLDKGTFLRWIKADPNRRELYREAKELATSTYEDRCIDIAEGVDANGNALLEDVQRSKLKIDLYLKLMGFHNRKVYGEVKTIDINEKVSIIDALAEARGRANPIINVEAEDVTDLPHLSLPFPADSYAKGDSDA